MYAWLLPGGESGVANAGVVVDDDGITVIDTLMVRSQWEPFAAAVAALDVPVRRTILTHAHIDHVGGTKAFPNAAIYGSQQTSDVLDQRHADRRVQGVHARVRRGVRRPRGARHARGHPPRRAAPRSSRRASRCCPRRGHTPKATCSCSSPTPTCASPATSASSASRRSRSRATPRCGPTCSTSVAELADMIVPGHGPRRRRGRGTRPAGLPARVRRRRRRRAARSRPGRGTRWIERERDAINVERAALLARGDDVIPPSMLKAMGLALSSPAALLHVPRKKRERAGRRPTSVAASWKTSGRWWLVNACSVPGYRKNSYGLPAR